MSDVSDPQAPFRIQTAAFSTHNGTLYLGLYLAERGDNHSLSIPCVGNKNAWSRMSSVIIRHIFTLSHSYC
jgi:hypothetical protein